MASGRSNLSFSVEKIKLANGSIRSMADATGSNAIRATPQHAGCVRVGPYLYVPNNISSSPGVNGNHFHTIAMLNVKTRRWKFMRCEGYTAEGAGVFLYQDSIFCLSAVDRAGLTSARLSCFDLALNEWSYYHTVGESPSPRQYFVGGFLEKLNRYVVFGGVGDDTTPYVLDLPERLWSTALASGKPPASRFQCGSCVHNGLIYIYGGFRPYTLCNDGLFVLKVESGRRVTWSSPRTNAHVIGPLSSFVLFPVGRILLLCGGVSGNYSPGLSYYDTCLREFRKVEFRPETREVLGAAMCGDRGGQSENGRSIALLGGPHSLRYMIRVTVEEA